jgi:hypothetical protein
MAAVSGIDPRGGQYRLIGRKMALFNLPHRSLIRWHSRETSHIALNELPGFQEAYVEEMAFG